MKFHQARLGEGEPPRRSPPLPTRLTAGLDLVSQADAIVIENIKGRAPTRVLATLPKYGPASQVMSVLVSNE